VTDGHFRAELGFAGGTPPGLKRGQSLDLRLTLGGVRQALVLPNGPWIEGSGGSWAFVLTSSGRAERRTIVTGRRNPEQVEVTRGLAAGDRVVVSSYSGLEPYKHLLLR
jgi:HlyD family secretion protein